MGRRGSLTVVGSGIRAIGHMTLEARAHVEQAEKVLVLVADPLTERWIGEQNPNTESLAPFYGKGKDRLRTYAEMTEHIMSFVRRGLRVCAVFYGHAGVFAIPPHAAVRAARAEGYPAEMLAGVSADACLYADLGIDPGQAGCQSFEATDFLVRHRVIDPRAHLVLWQIGVVGMLDHDAAFDPTPGLRMVAERLSRHYPPDHEVIVYEASPYAGCEPRIVPVFLSAVPTAAVTGISTLSVPPLPARAPDPDVLDRLGIDLERLVAPQPFAPAPA